MTWIAVPVSPEDVTAESLYAIGLKHRLVPENTTLALDNYESMATSCALILLKDEGTDSKIASVIISDIVDGEAASVDLIPVSKYFSPVDKNGDRNEEPVMENAASALSPVFKKLIDKRRLRRLTAMVPKTHSRAAKILRECGFRKEGVMRDAVKFRGKDAEDLVIMGMLPYKE